METFKNIEKHARKIGLSIPEIMIPSKNVDLQKWTVIACDQFTSEPVYWEKVREYTAGLPTTLNLMLPEAYLEREESDNIISDINMQMKEYISSGVLCALPKGFILVDRSTPYVKSRKGLLAALDLEAYDFNLSSSALARATEATVLGRIPPRVKIRENALLEIPHIMMLIDDPKHTVIEEAFKSACDLEPLYDFNLMMESGHLKGYHISDLNIISNIVQALHALKVDSENNGFMYAIGDGNHSLAAAKTHWNNIKVNLTGNRLISHPARYALVEIVNIHDPGLIFHPIHRVVFGIDNMLAFFNEMTSYYNKKGAKLEIVYPMSGTSATIGTSTTLGTSGTSTVHKIPFLSNRCSGTLIMDNINQNLAYEALQHFLDYYGMKVDYIHGSDSVESLSQISGNIGFLMPALDKSTLFGMISEKGVLPRKTFSMGEAVEKRFYLESRRIRYDTKRKSE